MRDSTLDRRMAEMAAHGDDDRASVTAARWEWHILTAAAAFACGVVFALSFAP